MIEWQTLVHPGKAGVPSLGQTLDVAAKQQLKFLVIPYVGKEDRQTVDQMKALAQRANRAGHACREAKIQLCYHHHSFEFAQLGGGATGWDILVQECDPELVKFEIDTFWAALGGLDPVKAIRDLGARVAQLHLKDLPAGTAVNYDEGSVPPETFQAVGDGSLDWPAVLAAARTAGVVQCHVEQDHAADPLASIARSIQHLKSL
jgi:sugar phosphate isomerase/epimerase